MCEGNTATVKGRLMYELKVSAFSAREFYNVYCLSAPTCHVMHRQLVPEGFSALTDSKQS